MVPSLLNGGIKFIFPDLHDALAVLNVFSFIFLGPGVLLQLGLEVLLPASTPDYLSKIGAPFTSLWEYILVTIVMGVIQFFLILHKESKAYELVEKTIYMGDGQSMSIPQRKLSICYLKLSLL